MGRTAKQELLELRLGSLLSEYVRERRARGAGWRPIADDLRQATGVEVSWETLRSWYPELGYDGPPPLRVDKAASGSSSTATRAGRCSSCATRA